MPEFFYNKPKICTNRMVTVQDVTEDLPAFNAMYARKNVMAASESCMSAQDKLRWMKFVLDGAIYCGGEQSELDFFEKNFNGNKKQTGATEVWVRYNCDKDLNVFAESSAQGSGPGQPVTFTVMRGMHAGQGKWDPFAKNGNLYVYEDMQWLRITNVDKTTDYAHLVTAIPFNKRYTANIRGKRRMMFTRSRLVDGYSCSIPSSAWDVPGYAARTKPFRARADWEIEIEFQRPWEDVMRFGITYDLLGNEVDGFELMETTKARQDFMYNKNLTFFLGQQIDNPLLVGAGLALRDEKYSGFNGYLNTLKYGGGFVQMIDPALGYGLDSDWKQLMVRQDSMKESNEFFTMAGYQFMDALFTRSGHMFRDNAQITFETFSRGGLDKGAVEKLGITSYKYLDSVVHFKKLGFLSDRKSIGNYNMPYMGFMMPGKGLRNDKGEAVSAIEFYEAGGTPENGTYNEIFRDHRKLDNGCEKFSGSIAETFQMAIHCPQKQVLLYPVFGQ
jgi:hypothetical protein